MVTSKILLDDYQPLLPHIYPYLRRVVAVLALFLLAGLSVNSFGASQAEEIIRNNCKQCHGTNGRAKVESWPNIGCQNRGYLYSRLMRFQRNNDHDIDDRVKSLSIIEVGEISRYYAEQKCHQF